MKWLMYGCELRWFQRQPNAVLPESACELHTDADLLSSTVARVRAADIAFHARSVRENKACSDETRYSSFADRRIGEHWCRSKGEQGQALIEYLLLLPLIFLLVINLVNFGGFFFAWITVANAARAGADYAILGGASVGSLQQATAAQISSLITQDISSLPNRSSLAIDICQNYNGTVTTYEGTCSAVPADPEPTSYALSSVDVSYTYQPFIPAGFQFPGLGIYLTIPPTTVHRRALMRVIQ